MLPYLFTATIRTSQTSVRHFWLARLIEMTMRYAHLTPDIRHNAVQSLDEPSPIFPSQIDARGAHGGVRTSKNLVTREDYEVFTLEAAGIEPASESLPPFDPTCVVPDLV